jgi:hypothetical protein
MNKLLLNSVLFAALAITAHGNIVVINDATDGGFANSDWIAPAEGAIATPTIGENEIFNTLFLSSSVGNADIYKAGTFEGSWDASQNAQSFTINIVGTPTAHGTKPGPRWRLIRSVSNGTTYQGSWVDLTEGENTISIGTGVSFNRMVGFQIAGVTQIDRFEHDYGSGTDSFTIVPEASHFGLLSGVAVLAFVATRRRQAKL